MPAMRRQDVYIMIVMFVLIDFGLAMIFFVIMESRNISRENQTYLHANSCVVSVSPTRRTPEYVKACYDQAEAHTGLEVTRYGDSK